MASTAKYTQNPPRVMLKNVRLSFPHLDKPQVPKTKPGEQPGVAKFNAAFICDDKSSVKITKDDGTVIHEGEVTPGMNKLIEGLISGLWAKRPPKMKPITCAGVVRETTGMGYSKDGDLIEGYVDGNYAVNAKNKAQPTLLTANKRALDKKGMRKAGEDVPGEEDYAELIRTQLYAGCRVDASVELYAADDDNGQAIYSTLRGIKFVADDTPLAGGGRTADADEFDDSEDDASFG